MTTEELRNYFNSRFQIGEWPDKYEVDAETYGLVCQSIFEHDSTEILSMNSEYTFIRITLGPNKGILFKNVELIIKK